MKIKGKTIIGTLLLTLGLPAMAQTVFSPQVNGLRSSYQNRSTATTRGEANPERGLFVVTCSMDESVAGVANKMKELGAEIRVMLGNQLVIDVPMSQLDDIAAVKGVLLIDIPSASKEKTDLVRQVSHVDEAHAGIGGLPQAYTGKGVIIGLIDVGYDYSHPMFKDKDGNLRIKGVYYPSEEDLRDEGESLSNINVTDEKGVSTTLTLTGEFITNADIILDTLKLKDNYGSHGTHCASIAAGRIMDGENGVKGIKEAGYLGGMAPEADILLSNSYVTNKQQKKFPNLSENNLKDYNSMQALYAMKHYAAQQNKPLVISWSQNNQDGFHDGTSTKARYIGNYCKQGNLMALCSSNEGEDLTYIRRAIDTGKTVNIKAVSTHYDCNLFAFIKTSKEIKVDLSVLDSNDDIVYVCNLPLTSAGKNDYEHKFYSGVTLNDDKEKVWTYKIDYYGDHGPRGNLKQYIKSGSISLEIGKGTGLDANDQPFEFVRINFNADDFTEEKDASNYNYNFMLSITSVEENVTMQAWSDNYSMYASTMEEPKSLFAGHSEYSIGDWNTSGEPVTIGAYTANIRNLNNNGELVDSKTEHVGKYASFSSYGYDFSAQKRTYPDVVTPGYAVLGADNSFLRGSMKWASRPYSNQFKNQTEPRNYSYVFKSGTSMATPAAAGIIALWVEAAKDKNKTLTNKDVKDIIAHSSDTDEFTQEEPIRYGAGKMNAYKGLLYVLGLSTGIDDLSQHQPEGISFRLTDGKLIAEGATDGTPASLYNLQGVRVSQTTVESGAISLAGLAKGVYAVQLGKLGSTLIRL